MKMLRLVCILATIPFVAAASTIGVTAGGATEMIDVGNFTTGWTFVIDRPITVLSLGYYDSYADGLTSSHDVGIWADDGNVLVTSATVPAGSASRLNHLWRFIAITPVSLTAGRYVIGASSIESFDPGILTVDWFVGSSGISVEDAGRYTFFDGLTYPFLHAPSAAFVNPNFEFSSPVPEPGAFIYLLSGIALLFAVGTGRIRTRRCACNGSPVPRPQFGR
jgi:hypothetical protein